MYIYQIVNEVNGKKYIGAIADIKKRFYDHRLYLRNNKHGNVHLQSAWNKYGEENFTFEILKELPSKITRKKLFEIEVLAIKYFKTKDRKYGYNLTNGGDGGSGFKHTPEQNLKQSKRLVGNKIRLGMVNSPESNEKNRLSQLGRKMPREAVEKTRLSNIGRKATPEQNEANRLRNIGKVQTEATRKKISDSQMGRKLSAESILKRTETRKKNNLEKFKDWKCCVCGTDKNRASKGMCLPCYGRSQYLKKIGKSL